MAMPVVEMRVWTAEDVRALPADPLRRFECVDGVLLVTPTPRRSHQQLVVELAFALVEYVRRVHVGSVIVAPCGVELDLRTNVEPDVYVLPLIEGRLPRDTDSDVTPLLVIEVLSPSTARNDRLVKRPRYQRAGIECWIVDSESRLVERWTPDAERPEILADVVTWLPVGAAEPFNLLLPKFFSDVLGD